ncbi:hypothetical protein SLS60_008321 [Paraconiothyrium brasiliense]|uniref:Transmembrane protein n=1 Tax=Paraconiothyrium brasiliense TaxID=300254 RepID=A0ABR3R094_9PLEO
MATTKSDTQLAALAAGFTLGFGFLTVWEAIKQTRRNKNPLRSSYIYMLWGEVVANIVIAIIGWVFLDGVPTLFFILFCWVFEIQLLMQIIINRIALIAEHRRTVWRIKWGTVIVITTINILVMVIWIPAHLDPPPSQVFVQINQVWDKISKVIILIVDAGLNWYFLRTVKQRLVQQHGLVKYAPLVKFNARLMVLSIAMDGMLIGLMFLKNQIVYIQFHPVTYMVKLNIEMTMASLVVRLAKGQSENDMALHDFGQSSSAPDKSQSHNNPRFSSNPQRSFHLASATGAKPGHRQADSDEDIRGIHFRTDFHVVSEEIVAKDSSSKRSSKSSGELPRSNFGDETPLHKNHFEIATNQV